MPKYSRPYFLFGTVFQLRKSSDILDFWLRAAYNPRCLVYLGSR